MSFLIDICLGLLLAWAFTNFKNRKRREIAGGIVAAVVSCLLLIIYYGTIDDAGNLNIRNFGIHGIVLVVVIVVACFFWNKLVEVVRSFDEKSFATEFVGDDDEEDYMKTRNGKIMMIICIILVIYMIVSSFCIFKLNKKVNSIYEITMELKGDK